jgi:hypothetical protein
MWPRDLLPASLDDSRYKGRYMTFGYPAKLLDSGRINQNINITARDMLDQIIESRGKV